MFSDVGAANEESKPPQNIQIGRIGRMGRIERIERIERILEIGLLPEHNCSQNPKPEAF